MSFSYPWLLLLLLLPAALGLFEAMRRGHAVRIPADATRRRGSRWAMILLTVLSVAPAVAGAMAVVILAGPKVSGPPKEEREVTNIEIVLDVSGSMGWDMPSKPGAKRYTAAMEAIERFTLGRQGDSAGLTIFGNVPIRWLPLTKDLRAIREATPFTNPQRQPPGMGGTAVGKALRYVKGMMTGKEEGKKEDEQKAKSEGDRLVIVVTDGESNDLEGAAGRDVGAELAAEKIKLFAINVGGGEMPQTLRDVTLPTGGECFNANDLGALDAIFKSISGMIPTKIKQGEPEPLDHARPFAIAAMIALAFHQLALLGLRYTPW